MCLTIRNFRTKKEAREFYNNPSIAKKDIIVYKALSPIGAKYTSARSPHKYFTYEKGNHYYNEGPRPFSVKIEKGVVTWRVEIHEGLHACTNKGHAKNHSSHYVKMIIPKGSKYFVDGDEIVSDNLIWPHEERLRLNN